MTNLTNYVNLSPLGTSPKKVDAVEIQAYSTGSGLGGLPGDFTAPSRFVRAAIFSSTPAYLARLPVIGPAASERLTLSVRFWLANNLYATNTPALVNGHHLVDQKV